MTEKSPAGALIAEIVRLALPVFSIVILLGPMVWPTGTVPKSTVDGVAAMLVTPVPLRFTVTTGSLTALLVMVKLELWAPKLAGAKSTVMVTVPSEGITAGRAGAVSEKSGLGLVMELTVRGASPLFRRVISREDVWVTATSPKSAAAGFTLMLGPLNTPARIFS